MNIGSAEKRLMYNKGDDFYFMTYNLLILLNQLGCKEGKFLKEFSKASFMIEFISNPYLIDIIEYYENHKNPGEYDLQMLNQAYSNSSLRVNYLKRLIYSLETRGVLKIRKDKPRNSIDISIADIGLVETFIDEDVFDLEIQNTKRFKKLVKRVTIIKAEKLIEELFEKYGVITWQLFE